MDSALSSPPSPTPNIFGLPLNVTFLSQGAYGDTDPSQNITDVFTLPAGGPTSLVGQGGSPALRISLWSA
jgi:hypothetical protein